MQPDTASGVPLWQSATRIEHIEPSALHFVPHCLQSALSLRPKLDYGPEKNDHPHPFRGGK